MRGRAKAMRRIRVEKGKGCIFDLGVGELWNWKRLEGDLDNRWGEAEEVCCGGLDGCVCVEEGGGCAGRYLWACLYGISSFKGIRRRIDHSPGGIVVGYTFVWLEWGLCPVIGYAFFNLSSRFQRRGVWNKERRILSSTAD